MTIFVLDYWARQPVLTQESKDVIDWLSTVAGQAWLNHSFRKPWSGSMLYSFKVDKPGDCDSDWTAREIQYKWPYSKDSPIEIFPELTDEDLIEPCP